MTEGKPSLPDDLRRVLIDEDAIAHRVSELADEINKAYKDIKEPLILVGVLKGSFIFLADLARRITIPHIVDFIAISSYGNKGDKRGEVRLLMDTRENLAGHHVLIVEDILDTGITLSNLVPMLQLRNPRSVRLCTILSKPSRRKAEIEPDYCGFEVPDEFVVGYGLDYDERYRNLPYVGVLKPEVYSK